VEVKLLEIFFNKSYSKDKWNWHLTQVILYFLELCGISYEFLKLKWHRALKSPTSSKVHYNIAGKKKCTNSADLKRWEILEPKCFNP